MFVGAHVGSACRKMGDSRDIGKHYCICHNVVTNLTALVEHGSDSQKEAELVGIRQLYLLEDIDNARRSTVTIFRQ